jgi:hypothetical protein
MGDAAGKVLPPVKGFRSISSSSSNVSKMDAMAIDMEVLSINPFWYGKDRDTAAAIVKMINEKLAELCASRPEGFGAFASLSLQFPDLAVQQIKTAIRKQGLRRAAVGASVLGLDTSIAMQRLISKGHSTAIPASRSSPPMAAISAHMRRAARPPDPLGRTSGRPRLRDNQLTDKQKTAIPGGNAARLFGMKVAWSERQRPQPGLGH